MIDKILSFEKKDINWVADPSPQFTGEINSYENVIVGPHGVILSEDGEYIIGANSHFEFWCAFFQEEKKVAENKTKFMEEKSLNKVTDINENVILALSYFNHYPFGHIWDTSQSLRSVSFNPNYSNYKLLCNLESHHTLNLNFHFSILGFPSEKRIHVDNGKRFFRIKKLAIPQLTTPSAQIAKRNFSWLVDRYISSVDILKPEYKIIYASRGFESRCATNENEVRDFCNEYCIKIISGNEPIDEIISYFYHAELIFGLHGSMLKHCIFNKNNARIVEFTLPFAYHDGSFKQNSSFAGVDYQIIRLEADYKHRAKLPIEVVKKHIINKIHKWS